MYNVYNSTRSDWIWALYFLNYFESELFYRDEPFIKNVSFGETQGKCYIFKIAEGIVHQFWIYNIFFVSQQKKHFLWKVHLDEIPLTRNNGENRVLKVSPTEYCYIYRRTLSTIFLNYFASQLFYRDGPFIINVSFVETRKKCYIFKIGEQSL